jgi:hypothetical protein
LPLRNGLILIPAARSRTKTQVFRVPLVKVFLCITDRFLAAIFLPPYAGKQLIANGTQPNFVKEKYRAPFRNRHFDLCISVGREPPSVIYAPQPCYLPAQTQDAQCKQHVPLFIFSFPISLARALVTDTLLYSIGVKGRLVQLASI